MQISPLWRRAGIAFIADFEQPSERNANELLRHAACTQWCMGEIRSFTDLKVWQRSMDLVTEVYRLTDSYPKSELFVLTSHTRRTAVSIPSNIADGFCRGSTATYIKHLNIALGSEGELFTQMECGRRLGFVTDRRIEKYFDDLSQVGKMLRGLIASLEQRHGSDDRAR